MRDRTADLLRARQALSQLSYNPNFLRELYANLVGLGRFELPTSPLSGVRSNQLSYRPNNWWSWSGSNRRPPECKSGALPAELQPLKLLKCNRGRLDAGSGTRPDPSKLI